MWEIVSFSAISGFFLNWDTVQVYLTFDLYIVYACTCMLSETSAAIVITSANIVEIVVSKMFRAGISGESLKLIGERCYSVVAYINLNRFMN